MHYELTLTAVADRDPSCNLFALSETFDLGLDRPSPSVVKRHAEELKERFLEMWPHNKQAKPLLVPVDADIKLVR